MVTHFRDLTLVLPAAEILLLKRRDTFKFPLAVDLLQSVEIIFYIKTKYTNFLAYLKKCFLGA